MIASRCKAVKVHVSVFRLHFHHFAAHFYRCFFFCFFFYNSFHSFTSVFSNVPFVLRLQRPVRRPETASSARLRSWWRRSSRLLVYGRVRAMAEASSSLTRMRATEVAAATAPWSRQHGRVQMYTREYNTHKKKHKYTHTLERTLLFLLCASLSELTW